MKEISFLHFANFFPVFANCDSSGVILISLTISLPLLYPPLSLFLSLSTFLFFSLSLSLTLSFTPSLSLSPLSPLFLSFSLFLSHSTSFFLFPFSFFLFPLSLLLFYFLSFFLSSFSVSFFSPFTLSFSITICNYFLEIFEGEKILTYVVMYFEMENFLFSLDNMMLIVATKSFIILSLKIETTLEIEKMWFWLLTCDKNFFSYLDCFRSKNVFERKAICYKQGDLLITKQYKAGLPRAI